MSVPTISLESLTNTTSFDYLLATGKSGGGASSSCGSSATPDDVDPAIWEKIKHHPCYSEDTHDYVARMHVPVPPACSIQCNWYNREHDCAKETRRGAAMLAITGEAYRHSHVIPCRCSSPFGHTCGPLLVQLAGFAYLFMCALLNVGVLFYLWVRRERGERAFLPSKATMADTLVAIALLAVYEMWTCAVSPRGGQLP
ncbi:hypothetical protein [Mesorhizobium sp. P13.3]|uniref:hypothetical protein n=1 Tax=Mesorhizobium sp. P13.3 TaxID=2976703 RepID=UPI0019CFA44C